MGEAFKKTNRDHCGITHLLEANQITVITSWEIRFWNILTVSPGGWAAKAPPTCLPFWNKGIIASYSEFWLLSINSLLGSTPCKAKAMLLTERIWIARHEKQLLWGLRQETEKPWQLSHFSWKKPELSFAQQTAMSSLVWNNYLLRRFSRTELMGLL